ncbi:MAG: hypothetical protein ACXWCZ_00840 [Flavisolibacter sp.]
MNSQLVETYLEAENDVKNNNYSEAFKKYESIIYDDPQNPMTHNSLGWIYKSQLDDYRNAESHYLAAIKSDPGHPHAYYNYASMLFEMERFEDLDAFLQNMLCVKVLDKAWVYHRFGLIQEMKLRFHDGIQFYEKAALISLSSEKIKQYKEDIERCNEKLVVSKKHSDWIIKLSKT